MARTVPFSTIETGPRYLDTAGPHRCRLVKAVLSEDEGSIILTWSDPDGTLCTDWLTCFGSDGQAKRAKACLDRLGCDVDRDRTLEDLVKDLMAQNLVADVTLELKMNDKWRPSYAGYALVNAEAMRANAPPVAEGIDSPGIDDDGVDDNVPPF